MNRIQTIAQIESGRVIAILRGDFAGGEHDMVAAMIEGGITAVEVTLNSPNALAKIARLVRSFGSQCAVGAGTVLTAAEVDQVANAGGEFIVSPNCDPRVIQATKDRGMISFPGAFTPTEILTSIDSGADGVKVFPATTLGPGFIKAVRAPLPSLRLIPTGGVTPEMARQYVQAGAWAIGVGSELLGKEILADASFETLRIRTADYVQAMKQ